MAGGDSGPAIAAGNPQASLLMQAVRYEDELKMPPEGKLPAEAIAAIETWIKMAHPWPAESRVGGAGQGGRRLENPLGVAAGDEAGAAASDRMARGRARRSILSY